MRQHGFVHDTYRLRQLVRPRGKYIGVDLATETGDHSAVVVAKKLRNKEIKVVYINEWGEWPSYKWYRNPIKWWKLRRVMKVVESQMSNNSNVSFRSTPPRKADD